MSERNNKLHGCWRLVSLDTELQDSRGARNRGAPTPMGILSSVPMGE
jgi:hypothetical protein